MGFLYNLRHFKYNSKIYSFLLCIILLQFNEKKINELRKEFQKVLHEK